MNTAQDLPVILGRKTPVYPDLRIKPYDFTRPDKFSREQIRTVSLIHESFCRKFGASLDTIFPFPVSVQVTEVDQMTFQESFDHGRTTGPIGVHALPPLPGTFLTLWDQPVSEVILSALGGAVPMGNSCPGDTALTELEKLLFKGFLSQGLTALDQAWSFLGGPGSQIHSIEDNPRYSQIVPPTEMVMTVDIFLGINNQKGMMRFVYPSLSLEPILEQLSAKWWYSRISRNSAPRSVALSQLLPIEAKVQVVLPPITIGDLKHMEPGTTLSVPLAQTQKLAISAGTAFLCSASWTQPELDKPMSLIPQADSRKENPEILQQPGANHLKEIHDLLDSFTRTIGTTLKEYLGPPPSTSHHSFLGQHPDQQAHSSDRTARIFQDLTVEHAEYVIKALEHERVSLQATIVTQLNNSLAADFLTRLGDDKRSEFLEAIIHMGKIPGFVLDLCSTYMEQQITSRKAQRHTESGGMTKAVDILNYVPASIERDLVMGWEKNNPDLAEKIKQHLFVFDDIVLLSSETLEKLLSLVDPVDFLWSIKNSSPEVRSYFEKTLGTQRTQEYYDRAKALGPVRIRDVDAAQARLIAQLQELDLAGEVVILRPNEIVE